MMPPSPMSGRPRAQPYSSSAVAGAQGGRERGPAEMLHADELAVRDGPAGHPLPRFDDVAGGTHAAVLRADDVRARRVAHRHGDELGRDDIVDRVDDHVVQLVGGEHGADLGRERDDPLEDPGTLGQVGPFDGQRQGDGDPVGDHADRGEVVLVERRRALDVEHAEEGPVGQERDRDLAPDARIGADVVGVDRHVRHERRLAGPGDPPDDPLRRLELVDGVRVAALRAQTEQGAVARVDRGIRVAERIHEQADDAVEGLLGRTLLREGTTDGLHPAELAEGRLRAPARRPEVASALVGSPGLFDHPAACRPEEDLADEADDPAEAEPGQEAHPLAIDRRVVAAGHEYACKQGRARGEPDQVLAGSPGHEQDERHRQHADEGHGVVGDARRLGDDGAQDPGQAEEPERAGERRQPIVGDTARDEPQADEDDGDDERDDGRGPRRAEDEVEHRRAEREPGGDERSDAQAAPQLARLGAAQHLVVLGHGRPQGTPGFVRGDGSRDCHVCEMPRGEGRPADYSALRSARALQIPGCGVR